MARRRTDGARRRPAGGGDGGSALLAGIVVVAVVAVVAVSAAFVVAAAVTGCSADGGGCAPAGGGSPGRPGPMRGYLVSSRAPGPPGGSRAVARAFGWRMLARFRLPAGARRAGRQAWIGVGPADRPGPADVTSVSAFYQVPVPLAALDRYLLGYAPTGMTRYGAAAGPVVTGVFDQVSYALQRTPAWVEPRTRLLAIAVRGRHGGTLLRVDARVAWFTPRTAAEYLRPSAFRAVVVRAVVARAGSAGSVPGSRYQTLRRTFTSPAAIRDLAGVLNGLHAQAGRSQRCPASRPEFRLSFVPRHGPPVVVTPAGCAGEAVTIGGRRQPMLVDGSSRTVLRALTRPARAGKRSSRKRRDSAAKRSPRTAHRRVHPAHRRARTAHQRARTAHQRARTAHQSAHAGRRRASGHRRH